MLPAKKLKFSGDSRNTYLPFVDFGKLRQLEIVTDSTEIIEE